jgi:AcrR family transcriptional regulator
MPRAYDMTKRAAAKEATRRRIIEATAKLHGEQGILGTSWSDIAQEADVSVATVYAHFPSLDELMPACGAHVMARIRPPAADQAPAAIGSATDIRERLRRAAGELFAYYERGGPHIEVDIRERALPGMQAWEEEQRELVAAFVQEAARPAGISNAQIQVLSAFFDLSTFRALRAREIEVTAAVDAVAEMASCLLQRAAVQSKEES